MLVALCALLIGAIAAATRVPAAKPIRVRVDRRTRLVPRR